MAKKKAAVGCEKCTEAVNEKLAPMNARITQGLTINFSTGKAGLSGPAVCVEKIDSKKRSKVPNILCSYCPFCGKKL